MRRPLLDRATRKGFTLVEVLIVVVILGILAATVLPQFTSATEDAKESALKQNLQQIRGQIDLYKFQHNGKVPAQGLADEITFLKCMLCTTDINGTSDGNVAAGSFSLGGGDFGPYLLGQFPPNPFNGLNTILCSASGVNPADGGTGWWYNSTTGEIRANLNSNLKSRTDPNVPINTF